MLNKNQLYSSSNIGHQRNSFNSMAINFSSENKTINLNSGSPRHGEIIANDFNTRENSQDEFARFNTAAEELSTRSTLTRSINNNQNLFRQFKNMFRDQFQNNNTAKNLAAEFTDALSDNPEFTRRFGEEAIRNPHNFFDQIQINNNILSLSNSSNPDNQFSINLDYLRSDEFLTHNTEYIETLSATYNTSIEARLEEQANIEGNTFPNSTQLQELAFTAYNQGKTAETIAYYNIAIAHEPSNAENHYLLGLLYAEINGFEAKAVEELQTSQTIDASILPAELSANALANLTSNHARRVAFQNISREHNINFREVNNARRLANAAVNQATRAARAANDNARNTSQTTPETTDPITSDSQESTSTSSETETSADIHDTQETSSEISTNNDQESTTTTNPSDIVENEEDIEFSHESTPHTQTMMDALHHGIDRFSINLANDSHLNVRNSLGERITELDGGSTISLASTHRTIALGNASGPYSNIFTRITLPNGGEGFVSIDYLEPAQAQTPSSENPTEDSSEVTTSNPSELQEAQAEYDRAAENLMNNYSPTSNENHDDLQAEYKV